MKIKNIATVSMLTIAGLAVASGTSGAAPAPGIHYSAHLSGNAVVIDTDGGSLTVADGQFRVLSNTGKVLAGVPLNYHLDDRQFPIEASIDGNTATLRPITDPGRSIKAVPVLTRDAVTPVAAKTQEERDKAAWDTMTKQVGFSVTIGAIIGAAVAAVAGCVVGGAISAPTAVVTAIFGPLAGCAAGAVAMAPFGALGGTLLIAAPVAVASAVQYFTTVNAPL